MVALDKAEIRHPGTESPSLTALLEVALDDSAWDATAVVEEHRLSDLRG
jgi:hypothetical protein